MGHFSYCNPTSFVVFIPGPKGMNMGNERGKVFMSVLKVWKSFVPSMAMGLNHKINCFGWSKYFMYFIVSVDLYTGILQTQAGTFIVAVH